MQTNGPHLFPADHGYAGNHDVSITVRALADLGPVIDAVVTAGGPDVTMHGVSFAIADPDRHLPEARRAAMAAAHMVATEFAEAGGAAVGEVVTIRESRGRPGPVGLGAEARMASATPAEAGELELQVDVDVTYRLVDRD